ncbi:MAG: C25 family cysteine peptidase [bacterium]
MLTKKILVVILLFTVFLTGDVIQTRITASPVIFNGDTPVIEGFNKLQIPGTPVLPAKSVLLALPPGARVLSIDIDYTAPRELERTAIDIAPPSLPLCMEKSIVQEALARYQQNIDRLTMQDGSFPSRPVYYSKLSYFRNIPFIRITFFPLAYQQGILNYYSGADILIHYVVEPANNSIAEWVDKNAAMFANWGEIREYYKIDTRQDSFDYVIITRNYLFSAFDSLVDWKNGLGYTVKLVDYDSILAQYPGTQAPDKIRNFLIDKYDTWGIHYLLLAGNVDVIPMKICFPDPGHNYDTPTDYYYAELTDDWDSDNDGYYGEYEEDSIGFVPEITVGRFPYNDAATLNSIVRKTLDFEMDTGSWKNRALLLAAFNNFENEDNTGWPACDGAALMEYMKDSLLSGWSYTRMYEEAGLCPSSYPHEQPLTQGNVVAEWSSGNYAVTNWSGHGNPSGAYRKYWAYDDGDSIPEDFEMAWETFIDMYDPPSLDDDHPSIVFAASCSNAGGDDNLARELIANGASGIVAATTYGWYTPGWEDPSTGNIMSLDYYFYHYLIADGKKVGDALFDAKMYYFNYLYYPDPWAGDPEWTPQQNMLDYNLFGDPSLVREGVGIEEEVVHSTVAPVVYFYPNPVRSQGYIAFILPFNGDVSISLYNIVGQRISTVYKGNTKAGYHSVSFTAKDLPGGVYFLRMEFTGCNDNLVKEQKIIVLH